MENPMIYGPNFIMMTIVYRWIPDIHWPAKKNSKRGRRDDSLQKLQDQIHPDIFGHDMLYNINI